ncbi:MAG: TolC family protein [Candidatus Kapaibacterium sp.]
MRKIILILTISFFAASGYAQTADSLSLDRAIRIALANNYSLLMAENASLIAKNNYSIGSAGFLPTLDVSGQQSNSVNNSSLEFLSGETIDKTGAKSNSFNAEASLNWRIFDGLENFNSYSRLEKLSEIGELEMIAIRESIIESVIRAYYDIIRRSRMADVTTEILSISEKRVAIRRQEYELGAASRMDMLDARADMNTDRAGLISEETMVENAKVTLNEIMGRDPGEVFRVAADFDRGERIGWDSVLNLAMARNPQLRLARGAYSVAENNLNTEYSELLPRIGLFAKYDYSTSTSEAGFIQSSTNYGISYGFNFSLNLFNGLNTSRRIENAKIVLETENIALDMTINRIRAELLRAYNNYTKNLDLLDFELENFDVERQRLDLAIDQLELGRISSLQFREAQRSYAAARGRIINARYNARVSEAELLRIAGAYSQIR